MTVCDHGVDKAVLPKITVSAANSCEKEEELPPELRNSIESGETSGLLSLTPTRTLVYVCLAV
jgi:hypothetical protein